MIYLSPSSPINFPEGFGQLFTPASWVTKPRSEVFAIDNGVFTGKFDDEKFIAYLEAMKPYQESCLFVAAPDVVGDYRSTLRRYEEWYPRLRASGWPVAYVAQDGCESVELPECQAVFIGGSTEWKMGAQALAVIRDAKSRGLWVHVGRVNTQRRIRHFLQAGVDSVDGTTIVFAPDDSIRLIRDQLSQPPLWRDLWHT